jgi:hypothetical protein
MEWESWSVWESDEQTAFRDRDHDLAFIDEDVDVMIRIQDSKTAGSWQPVSTQEL